MVNRAGSTDQSSFLRMYILWLTTGCCLFVSSIAFMTLSSSSHYHYGLFEQDVNGSTKICSCFIIRNFVLPILFFDVYNLAKWFLKWNKKSADLIFHAPFHKPILSYNSHQIIDPFRFNLNEQKIAKAYFNPQSVLIPKI